MKNRTALVGAATLLVGCAGILGVPDLTYDPNAPVGGDGGSSGNSSGGTDGSTPTDGGGGTCNADLQKDAKNCGRCGRDCLGAACTNGSCEPITLAQGLGGPNGIALDATHVYYTNFIDGTVQRVPKTGSTAETLAPTEDSPVGVAVSGNDVYWGAFAGTAGGVFHCDLTNCSGTKKNLTQTGYDRYVVLANGRIYFTNQSDVRSMQLDGGNEFVVGDYTQPFGLAVDSQNVYFTSLAPTIQRSQLDGGGQTAVGPANSPTNEMLVELDNERFYWAYLDDATKKGQVLSALKADPNAQRISYTTTGVVSIGVAVDGTYVYWSDSGTLNGSASNNDGTISACHKTGCTAGEPLVLATGNHGGGQMATDDAAVYWVEYAAGATGAGRVRKVAKP